MIGRDLERLVEVEERVVSLALLVQSYAYIVVGLIIFWVQLDSRFPGINGLHKIIGAVFRVAFSIPGLDILGFYLQALLQPLDSLLVLLEPNQSDPLVKGTENVLGIQSYGFVEEFDGFDVFPHLDVTFPFQRMQGGIVRLFDHGTIDLLDHFLNPIDHQEFGVGLFELLFDVGVILTVLAYDYKHFSIIVQGSLPDQ